jgi:hypothetical protein
MNTNPFPGYPKGEMMDTITNMNTNPSSGYPKEDMMDNFHFRIPRGRVRVYFGYIVHHFLVRIPVVIFLQTFKCIF